MNFSLDIKDLESLLDYLSDGEKLKAPPLTVVDGLKPMGILLDTRSAANSTLQHLQIECIFPVLY